MSKSSKAHMEAVRAVLDDIRSFGSHEHRIYDVIAHHMPYDPEAVRALVEAGEVLIEYGRIEPSVYKCHGDLEAERVGLLLDTLRTALSQVEQGASDDD